MIFDNPIFTTGKEYFQLANVGNVYAMGSGGSNPPSGPGQNPNPYGDGPAIDGPLTPGIEGPVTNPLLPSNNNSHEKNCEGLKDMVANAKIKSKMQTLQNKTDQTREFGYGYSDNADPVELQLKPGSDNLINVKVGGTYYGASHTHPNQTTTNFAPMFSISDIISLGSLKKRYVNPDPLDPVPDSKFVFTLTFKDYGGTGTQTYALKIENWNQFNIFIEQYTAMTPDEKENIGTKLAIDYGKIDRADSNADNQHLLTLLKHMKKNNLKGVAIYKATDASLSEWEKKSLDPENKYVISTNCN